VSTYQCSVCFYICDFSTLVQLTGNWKFTLEFLVEWKATRITRLETVDSRNSRQIWQIWLAENTKVLLCATQKFGFGQRSTFLLLTNNRAASGDENAFSDQAAKFSKISDPFHYPPENSGWMVHISEFNSFRNFWKHFKEIVLPLAPVSKVLEFFVEWKASQINHPEGWLSCLSLPFPNSPLHETK